MQFFVRQESIVRKIWGKSDTILFIFAGAAAEFALNKAVDWLYFTGKLPENPLERLFATVSYAGRIVFLPYEEAITAIDTIAAIHREVEGNRADTIPQWSYRDVLYMLVAYSISAYESLEHRLTEADREEVYDVFSRVGTRMGICDLPKTYREWQPDRESHLRLDLQWSLYTADLYGQYRKHLGPVRYPLLLQVQGMLCPGRVRDLLDLHVHPLMAPGMALYKLSRWMRMGAIPKYFLLPAQYKTRIRELDRA